MGSKRDEKGQKKNFNFFSSHVRSCDDLTAQPHVRCTCGPVRHHCLFLGFQYLLCNYEPNFRRSSVLLCVVFHKCLCDMDCCTTDLYLLVLS